MKKLIFILLIIDLCLNCEAQVYFNKRFDQNGSWIESARSILVDSGYFYTAITTMWNDGMGDLTAPTLVKLDNNGDLNDIHLFKFPHASSWIQGVGAISKISNGFLLTGLYQDSLNNEIFVVKTSTIGDSIWARLYGGTPYQAGWKITEASDGDYVISGQKRNGFNSDMYLMKMDTAGNVLWEKFYGDSTNGENALSFTMTTDNGYALVGYRTVAVGGPLFDIYIVKADSAGNMQWDTIIGNQWNEEARCIISTTDGNLLIGGFLSSSMGGFGNAFLCKLDLQGNLIWQKIYGDALYMPKIYSIKELPNGSIIATGNIAGHGTGINSFILKTNSVGDSIWSYEYFNSFQGTNNLYDIALSEDGGFIACGDMYPQPPDTGNQDCWFLKVDSLGCEIINCTLSSNSEIDNFEVNVYPNPFHDYFNIANNIGEMVDIKIYDSAGKLCMSTKSSSFRIFISTSNLTKGMYFLSVETSGKILRKKIIKL